MKIQHVACILFLSTSSYADGLSDLAALTSSTNNTASNVSALANTTDTSNSSTIIAAAQSQVNAVAAQISTTQQSVTAAQSAWMNGASAEEFSNPYASYCGALRTLANSLTVLARSLQLSTPSQSMINTINSCNDAVHGLGNYLHTHNIVTRQAWISTLNAMGALTDAAGAWNVVVASNATAGDSTASGSTATGDPTSASASASAWSRPL